MRWPEHLPLAVCMPKMRHAQKGERAQLAEHGQLIRAHRRTAADVDQSERKRAQSGQLQQRRQIDRGVGLAKSETQIGETLQLAARNEHMIDLRGSGELSRGHCQLESPQSRREGERGSGMSSEVVTTLLNGFQMWHPSGDELEN